LYQTVCIMSTEMAHFQVKLKVSSLKMLEMDMHSHRETIF
jgi:hypothetical protein